MCKSSACVEIRYFSCLGKKGILQAEGTMLPMAHAIPDPGRDSLQHQPLCKWELPRPRPTPLNSAKQERGAAQAHPTVGPSEQEPAADIRRWAMDHLWERNDAPPPLQEAALVPGSL